MVSEVIRIIAMCLREPRLTQPERYRFICIGYPLFHIVCCSELGAVILFVGGLESVLLGCTKYMSVGIRGDPVASCQSANIILCKEV
jgi:hypothetical protein